MQGGNAAVIMGASTAAQLQLPSLHGECRS